MKFGYALLLVGIVAVAGIATLVFGVDFARPFGSTNVVIQPEPLPEVSTPAKTTPAARPATARARQTPAAADPALTQEASQGGSAAAGGQTSAAGQKETDVYGGAALSIMRIDRGHDIETLVYSQNRGKKVAVVSLRDGKVAAGSPPSVAPAVVSPAPRMDEHATAMLARPAEPAAISVPIPPAAAAPTAAVAKKLDKTLTEASTAANPPARPPVQSNMGTCGEYRDGKLTVGPCSQVPLSTSEWLAKGASTTPAESAPTTKRP